MPHPGINEHPPWAGPQHPDFGPPPHGFNGQPPHMRRQGPPHINHDDPSLVPNVPYFDLPAGLMAPLVKVCDGSVPGSPPQALLACAHLSPAVPAPSCPWSCHGRGPVPEGQAGFPAALREGRRVGWHLRVGASEGCSRPQLEDHEYKALDPKDIRLPPPMPPSERLLAAVEAFYSPPSHDRPRNR